MIVSAFGPEATEVAARIGDGFVTTSPDFDLVSSYRDQGGKGPTVATVKVCWGPDEDAARETAHHLWASRYLGGTDLDAFTTRVSLDSASNNNVLGIGGIGGGPVETCVVVSAARS